MAVSEEILNHVSSTLRGLAASEATQKIRELATHYGVTPARLRELLQQLNEPAGDGHGTA